MPCPNPWRSGRPRQIFSLLINGTGQMIQQAYCSSGTAAWWTDCPLCALLVQAQLSLQQHDHSLPFPKVVEHMTFACAHGASPRRVTDADVLNMATEKRHRCPMNCQSKLHILLQTPFVWNIADFWRWIKCSYLTVTMRTWLVDYKRNSPYWHSSFAVSSMTLEIVEYMLQSQLWLWYRQLWYD